GAEAEPAARLRRHQREHAELDELAPARAVQPAVRALGDLLQRPARGAEAGHVALEGELVVVELEIHRRFLSADQPSLRSKWASRDLNASLVPARPRSLTKLYSSSSKRRLVANACRRTLAASSPW